MTPYLGLVEWNGIDETLLAQVFITWVGIAEIAGHIMTLTSDTCDLHIFQDQWSFDLWPLILKNVEACILTVWRRGSLV